MQAARAKTNKSMHKQSKGEVRNREWMTVLIWYLQKKNMDIMTEIPSYTHILSYELRTFYNQISHRYIYFDKPLRYSVGIMP